MKHLDYIPSQEKARRPRCLTHLVALLLFCFLTVGRPAPAKAMEAVFDAETVAAIGVLTSAVYTAYTVIVDELMGGTDIIKSAVLAAAEIESEINQLLAQFLADTGFVQKVAEGDRDAAVVKAVTTAGSNLICYKLQLNSVASASLEFSKRLAEAAGLYQYTFCDSSGKCFTPQGIGPQGGRGGSGSDMASTVELWRMCLAVKGLNEADGTGAEAYADTQTGTADACASSNVIVREGMEYLPSGETPTNDDQKAFQAAMAYCYVVTGIAAQRPPYAVSEKPEAASYAAAGLLNGVRSRAVFDKCALIVAKHTKPPVDSTVAAFEELSTAQSALCKIADNYGVDTSMYDDCESGLSYSQVRTIMAENCGKEPAVNSLGSTTTAPEAKIIGSLDICAVLTELMLQRDQTELDELRAMVYGGAS